MTTMQATDIERIVVALQRQVTELQASLDKMAVGVTGRQMLERGDIVVRFGSERTDTEGVRTGQVNYYISGSTVVEQIFDGTAWRAEIFT